MKKQNGSCSAYSFEELCLAALRKAGFRITTPRKAIIRTLAEANEPLIPAQVFDRLAQRSPKESADRVSVYRTLDTMEELGLVHKAMPSGAYIACRHLQCTNSYHVLSRCLSCNTVTELDVPSEVVAPLLFHLKSAQKFTPDPHLLHMDGNCVSCSRSK